MAHEYPISLLFLWQDGPRFHPSFEVLDHLIRHLPARWHLVIVFLIPNHSQQKTIFNIARFDDRSVVASLSDPFDRIEPQVKSLIHHIEANSNYREPGVSRAGTHARGIPK